MDSPQDTIGADYQSTWDRFVMDLQRLQEHLAGAVAAGDTPSLHGVLQQLHWIPYKRVRPLLKQRLIDTPSTNVGCITGFFFEVFTSTLVAARIKMALPETRIECNQTTDPTTLDIARDPDIFVARGPNKCVFEIKVSPKKRDLQRILKLKDNYDKHGIGYFLIGGYVALEPTALREWAQRDWACFLGSSARNQSVLAQLPTLDTILDTAVQFLSHAAA